jgi:ADP-ribose pyrophosphatase YjhB (NUDIX family)
VTGDDRQYPSRPWVGIGVVVLRGAEVLLIERGKPPRAGQWGIPGGAQHVGETVFDAAAREVMEETGVTIRPSAIITVVDSVSRDAAGRVRYHYTLVEVLAEWLTGEPEARDDAAAARWAGLGELDRLGLWAETARVIREGAALRDRRG